MSQRRVCHLHTQRGLTGQLSQERRTMLATIDHRVSGRHAVEGRKDVLVRASKVLTQPTAAAIRSGNRGPAKKTTRPNPASAPASARSRPLKSVVNSDRPEPANTEACQTTAPQARLTCPQPARRAPVILLREPG